MKSVARAEASRAEQVGVASLSINPTGKADEESLKWPPPTNYWVSFGSQAEQRYILFEDICL